MKLSKEYWAGVEEGRRHHQSSKTYSGKFLRPHKPFLARMITDIGATTGLDYGCGKGEQYRWIDPADGKTLEEAWGVTMAKFDPCWPPYEIEPEGPFDIVLCTHTLSLIPAVDLGTIVEHLFKIAGKGVFIAEKIGERKKGEVAQPDGRAIGWTVEQWLAYVGPIADRYPDIVAVFSAREKLAHGTRMTRYMRAGDWHIVEN